MYLLYLNDYHIAITVQVTVHGIMCSYRVTFYTIWLNSLHGTW